MPWSIGGLLAIAACASTPLPQTALEFLTAAQAALDAKNPHRARYLLEKVDDSSFKGEELARYMVLLATARTDLGKFWDAYLALEEFPRKFPTSRYRATAARLEYNAGKQLAGTGWTFLGMFSDLSDATKILEHFVTYYSRSQWLPDALRILGEAAYQQRAYDVAIERFQELAQRSPGSAWSDLASYRIALANFRLIEGPDYDAGQMERARRELTGYLQSDTTNEKFLSNARAALSTVLRWQERKEIQLAKFYVTVGKPRGARLHLQRVLDKPDPSFADEARGLLRKVEQLEQQLRSDG